MILPTEPPAPSSSVPEGDEDYERQLREMNEALLLSLVRQHELSERALLAERRAHEAELIRQRQLALTNALRVSTVGELATGLAHELNQPLASISNLLEACSQYVRAGKLDGPKLLDLLSDATGQALRAAAIVAHLRSFVSKGEPQLVALDLREVIGGMPHLLLHDLELARSELNLELPAEPLPVEVDRTQIEQVLVNLIRNAIDAIEEAGGPERRIEVRARRVDRMAEVSVRDTGAGIGAEISSRMFRPFFTTKAQGLGMGLALSRSILEAHEGRIRMDNPDDGGAGVVVTFRIPLREPA